jgi:hypothetical protein
MPRKCEALKKERKFCGGTAGDDGLCAAHKCWYDNNNWFNEVIQMASPTASFNRIRRICMNDKAVIQPDNTLESLLEQGFLENSNREQDRYRYVLIYNMYVYTKRIVPIKCPSIWTHELLQAISIIGTFQGAVARMGRERYLSRVKEFILPYLESEDITQFMIFLEHGVRLMNISLECWKDIIDTVVPHLNQKSITFYRKELLRENLLANIWIHVRRKMRAIEIVYPIQDVVDYAFESIDRLKVSERQRIKDAFYPLKEELMMEYFHPTRIERLIGTYGLDVLDDV